jgi:hypothetical protein
VLSNEKRQEVLSRISEIENYVIKRDDKDIAICVLCKKIAAESEELADVSDSLMPILRTALVINWKESAMKSRYNHFRKAFPEISTLSALKSVHGQHGSLGFLQKIPEHQRQ